MFDIVQYPRQFPFDHSDFHRNSEVNKTSQKIFQLLLALDNQDGGPSRGQPDWAHEEGRMGLLDLKRSLGFLN